MMVDPTHNQERGVSILLRYKGPAVDDGSMDVYQAAVNMMAFSDYVVEATHQLYGEGVHVKAEVNAFNRGSFETDLTFQVLTFAGTVLAVAAPNLEGVVTVVKESLDLFRFLRARSPEKVERDDYSNNVTVTNVNGDVTIVQTESFNLVMNEKAGKAAERFVGQALASPGVSDLQITADGQLIASVNDNSARFYHAIEEADTPLADYVVTEMGLTIEQPSFKDGPVTKWTMWDGASSLQYVMEDEGFIARVDNGELFGKGHILICDVRFTQSRSGKKLKIDRAIVKVHRHESASEQAQFDL